MLKSETAAAATGEAASSAATAGESAASSAATAGRRFHAYDSLS